MAPSKIKREADLTPPPRKVLGCFQNDSENMGTSSAHDSFAKPALKPLISDPNWKQCEREKRWERVKIKEQAARMAVSALKKMLNTLSRHLLAIPPCQTRIDKIRKCPPCLPPTSVILAISTASMLIAYTDEILARKKVGIWEKSYLITFSRRMATFLLKQDADSPVRNFKFKLASWVLRELGRQRC
jgi:hypothetical protein